jgi:creatinine amidohydrolase
VYELEVLSAAALRRLIDRGTTIVVVPFGSIEYQDAHLPLGADALLADHVGREVAKQLDAALAPTVRVGCAEQHIAKPGTLSLRADTLTDAAFAIAESLAGHGFRLIALLSTHGGNAGPLRAAAERFQAEVVTARMCVPEGDVGPHPGSHSGHWLTSVMLALRPDLVRVEDAGSGLTEEVQSASSERGAIYLERFVSAMVAGVRAASRT